MYIDYSGMLKVWWAAVAVVVVLLHARFWLRDYKKTIIYLEVQDT